jgi:hypothetical protein
LKLDALLRDIKDSVLGNVIAKIWVIEFQKRGLPHAHILLILDEASKLCTAEDFDSMVSAEIPNSVHHPEAYETVTSCMGHVVQIFSTHNAWSRESARKGTRVPLVKKRVVMLIGTPSIGTIKPAFL